MKTAEVVGGQRQAYGACYGRLKGGVINMLARALASRLSLT
jgi:hypothetical protein